VDAPGFPAPFLATARDQGEALAIFRASDTALRWSYVSPPPKDLVFGAKTGRYRAEARDTPITDEAGQSRITIGDFASAVVDAVERDQFVGQRFTVAY
jgi:putative NADH-flavin reductase